MRTAKFCTVVTRPSALTLTCSSFSSTTAGTSSPARARVGLTTNRQQTRISFFVIRRSPEVNLAARLRDESVGLQRNRVIVLCMNRFEKLLDARVTCGGKHDIPAA